jgi:hypothetical protein
MKRVKRDALLTKNNPGAPGCTGLAVSDAELAGASRCKQTVPVCPPLKRCKAGDASPTTDRVSHGGHGDKNGELGEVRSEK